MNKQKSKYFNTASLFDEALIILLEQKDIEYITIKEICERAGVNRSTFYLHYESINDLLEETMDYINNKFQNSFENHPEEFINQIDSLSLKELNLVNEKYLIPYLNFIKDNKRIFKASFSNPISMKANDRFNSLKKYVLNPILEKYNVPDQEKKFLLSFYVHGIMAIIEEWLCEDCSTQIETIEKYIYHCVRPEIKTFGELHEN